MPRELATYIASPFGLWLLSLALLIAARPATSTMAGAARWAFRITTGLLIAFAFPPVADLVARPLEDRALMLASAPRPTEFDVILVLSGTVRTLDAATSAAPEPFDSTGRLWHAARLYREGIAPVLLLSGADEAETMRDVLIAFGVPPNAMEMEQRSTNTEQNLAESARFIGARSVALVTSALHMPRAIREAEVSGIRAHPFPTDYRAAFAGAATASQWLPSPGVLAWSTAALKEWQGLLAIGLRSRFSEESSPPRREPTRPQPNRGATVTGDPA